MTLRGLDLRAVPFTRVDAASLARFQATVPVLARLVEVGLLPPVTPGPRDTVLNLIARMQGVRGEEEFLTLQLSWYDTTGYDGYQDDEARSPHELALTHLHGPACTSWTCLEAQDELRALHPWLLGSLLYHVSEASALTYPIYTARDAIEDEEMWSFDGCLRTFWKGMLSEYRHEHKRDPEKGELLAYAASEREKTPRDFLNLIGQEEWVPVLSKKRRLSLEEIEGICHERLDRVWSSKVLDVVTRVRDLHRINAELDALDTPSDHAGWIGTGETRKSPVAILSASVRGSSAYQTAVQERLEESWELAAQTSGFFQNLFVRLNDEADADRAAQILPLHAEAFEHVREITHLLADKDGE